MALPLEGKVAIVTGSSRGIGKEIAMCLAEDGADVVVAARSDASAANPLGSIERTAEALRSATGRRVLPLKVDVTNDDDVRAMVETTLKEFGRIDIMVNNAARMGQGGGDFWGSSPDTIDAYYQTNLRAPYLVTLLVGEHMAKQGGGTIVNVTSMGADLPKPPGPDFQLSAGRTYVGYGITKAALNRWMAGVAGELRLRNIAIFNIDPGRTVVERNIVKPIPGVDYNQADMPEVTGRAVAWLCRNAMDYTGRIMVARKVVDENALALTGRKPTL